MRGSHYDSDSDSVYYSSSDEYTDDYSDEEEHDNRRRKPTLTKPTGKDAKTFAAFSKAHKPDIMKAYPRQSAAQVNKDLIELWYEMTSRELKEWREASK